VTFEELNLSNPLINALTDLDFVNPTPVQQKAFPIIMSGKNLVAIAQTGTGKTFAYLLPLLRQLKFSEQRQPRILIVVPTRELVLQIVEEVKKLTTYINIRTEGIYGGTNIKTQKQLVYDGSDILVATPGRLIDLVLTGVLRLKSIQKLVIDEVDEMLNLGFKTQLISVLELLPEKRQNLMFSATLTEQVDQLISEIFTEYEKIEVVPHGTPLDKIIQKAYFVPNFYTKINLLEHLLKTDEELKKVLVFVGNKKLADRLFETLNEKFPDEIGVIHSNKSQNNRIRSLENFENETHRVLIATDIIARGLDITDVTHVINFDTPELPEDYIHRIGRTGRADKDGIAITFVNEAELGNQNDIEDLMNKRIPMVELPENLEISKIFTDDEKPTLGDKTYLKTIKLKGGGAFHSKSELNKKVNLGSPYKRMLKKRKK
jgi:ATP-dependent RNA helicase RhlE